MLQNGALFVRHNLFFSVVSAFFFGLILFFALEHLTETPPLWYDEGMYTENALTIAAHGRSAIQTAPGEFASAWSVSGGFPFLYPIALSYLLADPSVLSGRLVMVFFMLLLALGGAALPSVWNGSGACGSRAACHLSRSLRQRKNSYRRSPWACVSGAFSAVTRVHRTQEFQVRTPGLFCCGHVGGSVRGHEASFPASSRCTSTC